MSSKKTEALVVVAHPDDETIFFGGLILSKAYKWTVVCATDGNADGRGNERALEFYTACKKLGVHKATLLGFPDKFSERLDTEALQKELLSVAKEAKFKKVFTHGILGEYQHPHHQDVSYATHKTFGKSPGVFAVGYNTFPHLRITLSESVFRKKTDILSRIYSHETLRFQNILPATTTEGFLKTKLSEIEHIYSWLLGKTELSKSMIPTHSWLFEYLKKFGGAMSNRIF